MISIKELISTSVISSPDHIEAITIKLSTCKQIILSCIFIPPNSTTSQIHDVTHYLADLLTSFTPSEIIIVGDFNLPDINWESLSAASPTFCDFVFDSNLVQLVHEPTHIKGNLLDLVLSSSEEIISNLKVSSQKCIVNSDHFAITFNIIDSSSHAKQSLPANCNSYIFYFPKADYDSICHFLMNIDFNHCLFSTDLEHIWWCIKNAIYAGMNLFPKVRIRSYQYPSWYNPELRHLSKCLLTLCIKIFKSTNPTQSQQEKLFQQEDDFVAKASLARAAYESKLIYSFARNHNSKIYSYINSLSKNSSIPPTVTFQSKSASDDYEKATLFNSFFHSVFTESTFSLPRTTQFISSMAIYAED